MSKIFISYSHQQISWVTERLVPCLEAGGAEVLIDRKRFAVGKAVIGQMDAIQDQADKQLLVLSPDYLNSKYCRHEMNRALQRDPKFQHGVVVPVMRIDCTLPAKISSWNSPLYADLRDDQQPDPWAKLLQQCGADLATTAPHWLGVRNDIVRFLKRNQSVNLVVQGHSVNWRALLGHVRRDHLPDLVVVNLEDPDTMSRHGLLTTISRALDQRTALPDEPRDLSGFKTLLSDRPVARVVLMRFDLASHRPYYDVDLYAALRYLITDMRKLVLLVESHTPFKSLLPADHPLSPIDIKLVELQERL